MKENIEYKKYKCNSYIMALFVYQFGFMQLFASLFGGQWVITVFTLILLGAIFYVNRFCINKRALILLGGMLLLMLLSSMITSSKISMIFIGECLAKAGAGIIIASFPFRERDLYQAFKKIAILNFMAIALYPFLSFYTSMNYMRFGYAMAPSAAMFFVAFLIEKRQKILWLIMTAISSTLTVFYGSRGALLVLLILGLLCLLVDTHIKISFKIAVVFSLIVLVWLVLQRDFITQIMDFIYYDLGIQTYTVKKIKMQISLGLAAASSGRNVIYSVILNMVSQKPILGFGIGAATQYLDVTAHNIFLQILLESGVLGLVLWSGIWIYLWRKMMLLSRNRKRETFCVVSIVIASACARLLISSDMWMRPEYWFSISFLVSHWFGKSIEEE